MTNSKISLGLDADGVIDTLERRELLAEIKQLYTEKERLERKVNRNYSEEEILEHIKNNPLAEICGEDIIAESARLVNPMLKLELAKTSLELCHKLKFLKDDDSLRKIIEISENTLQIYSCKEEPYIWSTAKSNIGHAQIFLSGWDRYNTNIALLEAGAEALTEAFECYERHALPEECAMTGSMLAYALDHLATLDPHNHSKSASVAVLEQALAACQPSSPLRIKLEEQLRSRPRWLTIDETNTQHDTST